MTIKLETNIPTVLGFPFGDFQEKESQFGGVSYMCKATLPYLPPPPTTMHPQQRPLRLLRLL